MEQRLAVADIGKQAATRSATATAILRAYHVCCGGGQLELNHSYSLIRDGAGGSHSHLVNVCQSSTTLVLLFAQGGPATCPPAHQQ